MRRFHLQRLEDASGVSGTGVVAQGVEFDDGACALRWLTATTSTGLYASAEDLVTIHGHEGRTQLVWLDDSAPPLVQVPFVPGAGRDYIRSMGRRSEIIAKLRKAVP